MAGLDVSHDEPDFDGAKHSAVLAVLADGPHGAEVLLTRRSMDMTNHRGEVSFPGGRLDPGETYEQAALREAHEEVGLDPADVWAALEARRDKTRSLKQAMMQELLTGRTRLV